MDEKLRIGAECTRKVEKSPRMISWCCRTEMTLLLEIFDARPLSLVRESARDMFWNRRRFLAKSVERKAWRHEALIPHAVSTNGNHGGALGGMTVPPPDFAA